MKKAKIKVPPNWEDTPKSFERFKRLARALVSVPKRELEKEFQKAERKKEKRPKIKN